MKPLEHLSGKILKQEERREENRKEEQKELYFLYSPEAHFPQLILWVFSKLYLIKSVW